MDKDFLAIGRLGAPKGVRGDLKIQSYSGEFKHFMKLREVELRAPEGLASAEASASGAPAAAPRRGLRLKVVRAEGGSGSLTMAFEGYPSPEKARELTGFEIIVPRSQAAPLAKNEYYVTDLVGLDLVSEGQAVAKVRSVLEGGPDPWLEALLPGGRVALVPFRKEFVGEVDIAAARIELLAPWLLEE